MRRLVLAGIAALGFAPAAHASCGIAATALTGKAPLTVTLTARCASAAYTWDLGDGTPAVGPTVQHSYAAGSWRPTLTSDAGVEKVGPVTSVSLTVSLPRRVRYARYVALRATVVPRIPVTYRGRRFQHGAHVAHVRARTDPAAGWAAVTKSVTVADGSTVYVY